MSKQSLLTSAIALTLIASACASSQSGLIPAPSSTELDVQQTQSKVAAEPNARASGTDPARHTGNQTQTPADGAVSFEQAVMKAANASELTDVAQTVDDWERVTEHWQEAVTLLQTIPTADEKYAIAQQRLPGYQKQLKIAQQQATQLAAQQDAQYQQRAQQGEQIFQTIDGSYQLINVLQGTPAMQVVVLDEQWQSLSKAEQVDLVEYARSLVQAVRSAPDQYVDVSDLNPIYDRFISKASGLCDDCWQIVIGEQPSISSFSELQTVVQGDDLWEKEDPCCRGKKVSEFVR